VSIAIDGGKGLSACLRAWPKPEFRQARHQREAQRPDSFRRRAFFFLVLFHFGDTKKKKKIIVLIIRFYQIYHILSTF